MPSFVGIVCYENFSKLQIKRRRQFDKEFKTTIVELLNSSHTMKSVCIDYDLKEAKEDFRLWDKLYGRDVIKHLEQVSKWEPGKKEREKKERLAALEIKQV